MKNTPVDYQTARRIIDGFGLRNWNKKREPSSSIWKWAYRA